MATSIGDRFVRRQNAARSSTSNTTAADITYDTAVLTEGGYSWSSPSVTVDTAGKYLYIGDLGQANLASTRAVGTHVPAVNGTTQEPVGLASHRYLRNSSGAQQGASIGMGILSLSASDAVKVRNPGAILSVDAVGNYATNASYGGALQLIRLPDTGDYLHLERSADAAEVGISNINTTRPWLDSSGTWTKMTWPTEVADSGGWHTASSGDVTLPASKKFLIVWTASHYTTDASRNTFVTALNIAGTRVQTASGYQRNTSSQGPPHCGMYLHETGGSSETLYLEATQETEGGDAGTPKFADGALQIIELPASAEWVHADNGTTSNALATALASTSTWYTTPLLTGSTVRTDGNGNLTLDGPNNAISNDSGGSLPVLAIGWHRWDRDTGSSGNRKAPWSRWNNGGSAVGYGIAGAYSRGQQSNDDTFQAHYVAAATMDMASAALLTFEVNDPVNGNNSDMGIYTSTAGSRYFLGVQVLDLSSLTTSSLDATATPTAIAATTTLPSVTVKYGTSTTTTAVTPTSTLTAPAVAVGAKTELVAVELSGTYTASAGDATVTLTAFTPTVTLPSVTVTVAVSITVTAIAPTVTLPTPVFSSDVSIAATAVTPAVTLSTPTVTHTATVTLTAFTPAATLPVPVLNIDSTVSLTAFAGSTTIPPPAIAVSVTIAATAVTAATTLPTPVVVAAHSATIDATAIVASATLPAPSVSVAVTATTTAITGTTTLPTPSVAASVTVTPTAVTGTTTLPTPVVAASNTADITTTAIAGTATLPTPATSTSSTTTTTAIAGIATVLTPAITTVTNITATAIAPTVTVGTHTVAVSVTITTTAVAPTVTLPTPSVEAQMAANITATAIVVSATLPQPVVNTGAGAEVTPTAIAASATIGTPAVTVGAKTELVAVELSGTYTQSNDVILTPSAIVVTSVINDQLPSVNVTYYLSALTPTVVLPAATIGTSANANISLTAIACNAIVLIASSELDAAVAPTTLSANIIFDRPIVYAQAVYPLVGRRHRPPGHIQWVRTPRI